MKRLMQWLKRIIGLSGRDTTIELMRRVIENNKQEIERLRGSINYVTLPVATGEQINSFLANIGKETVFRFYLLTLENEIMALFRDGKDADVYRGGLRMLDRIRQDILIAQKSESRKNAQV